MVCRAALINGSGMNRKLLETARNYPNVAVYIDSDVLQVREGGLLPMSDGCELVCDCATVEGKLQLASERWPCAGTCTPVGFVWCWGVGRRC
jgi:hypothetical protein